MAKEDFCFNYYDGDAARDVAHMNRLERGAYYDLMVSQRKFGRLSMTWIIKTLGSDFEEVWPSLEVILVKDEEGKFYIEWIENSINKMKKQSEKQSENGKKGGRPRNEENPKETQKKPKDEKNESQEKPLGSGYGNEYELGFKNDLEGGMGETFVKQPIISEARAILKNTISSYPLADEDNPAIRSILVFILEQNGVTNDLAWISDEQREIAIEEWKKWCIHIRDHPFHSSASMDKVNKFYKQEFFQDVKKPKNGNNQAGTIADRNTRGALQSLEKVKDMPIGRRI